LEREKSEEIDKKFYAGFAFPKTQNTSKITQHEVVFSLERSF